VKDKIYLAGPIDGCTLQETTQWRNAIHAELSMQFDILDPARKSFEDMVTDRMSCLSHAGVVCEHDKSAIDNCDILLANCWKPSAGTSMEIMYAYERGRTVLSIVPKNAHLSPWVARHSQAIFLTTDEAINFLRNFR